MLTVFFRRPDSVLPGELDNEQISERNLELASRSANGLDSFQIQLTERR